MLSLSDTMVVILSRLLRDPQNVYTGSRIHSEPSVIIQPALTGCDKVIKRKLPHIYNIISISYSICMVISLSLCCYREFQNLVQTLWTGSCRLERCRPYSNQIMYFEWSKNSSWELSTHSPQVREDNS